MTFNVINSERVAPYLLWIKNNEVDLLSSLQSLSSGYGNLAIEHLGKTVLSDIQNLCNKGSETSILMLDLFLNKISFDIDFKSDLSFFPVDIYYNMLFCSQHVSNYKKFARNNIDYDENIRHKRGSKIYDWPEVFLALSYLVLEEEEQCEFRLTQATFDKKPSGQLKGYSEIIRGILERNNALIYEGIEKQLKWFKKSSQSDYHVDFPYNFPVMGFINFARYKGIEIDIESVHIHPEMIAPLPENFVFEGIPEVYDAIEKAKRKNIGVLGRLKGFFG